MLCESRVLLTEEQKRIALCCDVVMLMTFMTFSAGEVENAGTSTAQRRVVVYFSRRAECKQLRYLESFFESS